MDYTGRNTVWGFRERVLKNLEYLNSEREMGADVHVVTELITSLLGLIVFPYEEIKERGYSSFERYKLNDLPDSEWPSWKIEIGSSDNLADLVRHLRNAISHRRIYFSSDSRRPEDVDVRFRDCKNPKGPADWGAIINAAQLRRFVLRFAELLKEWERDYS
jgi:hypothetical protein